MSITSLNGITYYSAPSINRQERIDNTFSFGNNIAGANTHSASVEKSTMASPSRQYDIF